MKSSFDLNAQSSNAKKALMLELSNELQTDNESPQTNFERVMAINASTPARQFRTLLDLMHESLSFEKNMIERTACVQVPAEILSQNKRVETYKNYQKVLKYSNFMRQKQHFNNNAHNYVMSKSGKFENNKNLNEIKCILQHKKNKLLIDESLLKTQQENVKAILNDSAAREKLFEEALLIERLQEIQHKKSVGRAKLARPMSQTKNDERVQRRGDRIQILGAYKPESSQKLTDTHPKHLRINYMSKSEEQYQKNKFVCNQSKLKFYNYVDKIKRNSIYNQKQENKGVINTIIKFNDQLCKISQAKNRLNSQKINQVFLKYSNSETENPQNMFMEITVDRIKDFLNDFEFEWTQMDELCKYIHSLTSITNFEFLEILYILHRILAKDGQFVDLSLDDFLDQRIHSKKMAKIQYWPQIEAVKKKYAKIFKFYQFEEMVADSCNKIKRNVDRLGEYLSFSELTQFLWVHQLFPCHVSKKIARFAYLYGRTEEVGVTHDELINVLIFLGLKCAPCDKRDSKVKWLIQKIGKKTSK